MESRAGSDTAIASAFFEGGGRRQDRLPELWGRSRCNRCRRSFSLKSSAFHAVLRSLHARENAGLHGQPPLMRISTIPTGSPP
eukprot:7072719-Pyramimonas_sp.AAC.1